MSDGWEQASGPTGWSPDPGPLPPAPLGGIPGAAESRRGDIQRFEESAGGVFTNDFRIAIQGVGECTAQLPFSVRFVEEPMVATGWAMKPNQKLHAGQFPVVSVGVYTWKFGRQPSTGLPFYDGATLAINFFVGPPDVAGGGAIVPGQRPGGALIEVHASFRGKALRDPAGR